MRDISFSVVNGRSVAAAAAAGRGVAAGASLARLLPVLAKMILERLGGGGHRALGEDLALVRLGPHAPDGGEREGDGHQAKEGLHRAASVLRLAAPRISLPRRSGRA